MFLIGRRFCIFKGPIRITNYEAVFKTFRNKQLQHVLIPVPCLVQA